MLARREQADKECEVLETVRFRAGDTIFSQNEWGNAAYLVNCGQVEVTTAQGSVCRTVRTAGPGEVFGDACLMEPGLRRITATAITDTQCRIAVHEAFMMAVDTAPLETVAFMQALLRRFWDMSALLPSLDPAGRGLSAVVADLQLIHLCEEVTESGYRHEGAPHREAAAQESPA